MESKELNTAMTKIQNKLIVTLNSDLVEQNFKLISDTIVNAVEEYKVSGVVIDFSVIKVMSSYTYKIFKNLTRSIIIMGIDVVWVGLNPGVIVSLMDLNLIEDACKIKAGFNVEQGLKMLSTKER